MPSLLHLESIRLSRRRRWCARRRLRLVAGLRNVARRAGTGARPRQFDALLRNRAALVRPQLLQVAAALERVAEPDPETVRTLHWLLTDGCASPLFNERVPTAELMVVLDRAWRQLEACEGGMPRAPRTVSLAPDQERGAGAAPRRGYAGGLDGGSGGSWATGAARHKRGALGDGGRPAPAGTAERWGRLST